jgi:hypothetical protein
MENRMRCKVKEQKKRAKKVSGSGDFENENETGINCEWGWLVNGQIGRSRDFKEVGKVWNMLGDESKDTYKSQPVINLNNSVTLFKIFYFDFFFSSSLFFDDSLILYFSFPQFLTVLLFQS